MDFQRHTLLPDRRLYFLVVLVTLSGCGPGPTLSELDQEPLQTLEPYQPDYQLDNDGRVIFLKLERRQNLDTSVLREIGKLSELRQVSFYGSPLMDGSLAELKNLKRLQQIGLGATGISDNGLEHLKNLDCLQRVWLPRNGRITQEKVEEVCRALPGLIVSWQ